MSTTMNPSNLETLRWTPLMSVLTDAQFEQVLATADTVDYALGDSIDYGTEEKPAMVVLLSGSVRVSDEQDSRDQTLFLLTEAGAFFSSELPKRARISSPALHASGNAQVLRMGTETLAQLISQSPALNEKLYQESRILKGFMRLRSTPRFKSLSFWPFRPILSQSSCFAFEDGEQFSGEHARGLFIILNGSVSSDLPANEDSAPSKTVLQPGDWFARGCVMRGYDKSGNNEKALGKGEILHISEEAYAKIKEISPELVSQMDLLLLSATGVDQGGRESAAPQVLAHITDEAKTAAKPVQPVAVENETAIPKLRRKFKKYPFVYQHSELECAITCLHMICLFYGKNVSLVQLREVCEIGRSGSSMLELAEAAEQLGFISRGVRTTYPGLAKLRLPVILYWKRNHFVVLYEVHPQYALVGDPGEGLITIPIEKFRREFSEHALELAPTVEWFEQDIKSKPIWQTFLPLLAPHKMLMRDVVLCSLFYQLLQLTAPVFTQVVIDQVVVHQDLDTLNILLFGMILMTIFQSAMSYLRQFFLAFLSLKADQSLYTELLKRLLSLPLEYFGKHSTGDTLTRFSESAGVVQFLTGMGATAVLDVLMASVFLCVVFAYNVTFGLTATAYVVAIVVFMLACGPTLRKQSQKTYDKQMAAQSFLVEALQGIERIKSAAAESRSRWRWESLFLEKLNVRLQEYINNTGVSMVCRLLQLAAQINFLWLGAHMIIAKELSIGQLMAMTMMIGMIMQPFMRLADLAQYFQSIQVAMDRVAEVFMEQPEESDAASKVRLAEVTGHVKFDKVTYHYPGREGANALANFSFEAKPGQMIGIVGRSGSGKSTLTRLIQGLYCPSEGKILIDGHDLSQVALPSYRRKIGVVSQNEYFFRGTVRENIAFYKPDATLEEIIHASTVAGINEMISALPSGYETVLNEGAANFSGGQRQCMAIARAILHEPSILIFDEATSAMDSETERLIQECMERLRAKSTMFVVAHRLSTIMSADLILVVDRGQLVESGSHDELMEQKGLYYYLCKKQALAV